MPSTIEREAAELDVLAEVTRRFIAVAQRQEQLQLFRDAVELAEHTVAASERRVNAAKSPHAELDRARIALDRAKLDERGAQIELDTARRQLAATWGETRAHVMNGDPSRRREGGPVCLAADRANFAELVAGLAGNPDFLLFASEARLRDAELRLAASQRKPDVTLGAGVRHSRTSNDQAFVLSRLDAAVFRPTRADPWRARRGPTANWSMRRERLAEVRAQATLYELHQQLQRAIQQARTLRDDIQPRSAEALKETEYAYERGRYGYIELVDAQREYLAVREALIEAAASAHTLRAEIERLTNAPLTCPRHEHEPNFDENPHEHEVRCCCLSCCRCSLLLAVARRIPNRGRCSARIENAHDEAASERARRGRRAAGGHHEERRGHIALTPEQIEAAGIQLAQAGPARHSRDAAALRRDRTQRGARARCRGALSRRDPRTSRRKIGDPVREGETLATVEATRASRPTRSPRRWPAS